MTDTDPNTYPGVPGCVEGPFTDKMRALLAEWQDRLRLRDWDIDLRVYRGYDMPDCRARTQIDLNHRMVILALHAPDDYDPAHQPDRETGKPYEPEASLLHELVHIHLDAILQNTRAYDEDAIEHALMEAAVDSIAKGLYRAKYDAQAS